MARARIQEVMTGAYDQDGLASFYCDVFGMKVVWRRRPAPDGSRRGLFLSDGLMVLCIQQAGERGGQNRTEGLQGIGIVIENVEDVDRRAVRHGVTRRVRLRPHPDGEGYVDAEIIDPIGTQVNLAMNGFGIEPLEDVEHMPPPIHPGTLPERETGLRRVVFEAEDAQALGRFYRDLFDLHTVRRDEAGAAAERESPLTDGRTDLWFEPMSGNVPVQTAGRVARIGVVVADVTETLRRAAATGARETHSGDRGTSGVASACVVDPVGVRVDISEPNAHAT